ncbi:hypothetical protein [[Limnothrix rosea] IAM M-220]|uniref:hypothetical protein n=1 Tax=[Limnothrix rosea] IAM M-220 TaxID=454133 RepID=UPI00095D5001|nr:hypothetical protein [[Limnothrix rosea] IAM M-220]OKH14584.1 hypothetical protein NIES208_13865 [[Limnothrix rosea] IAM M-220]
MLVILTEGQVLPTDQVCQGCLMADQSGAPRLRHGVLKCGRAIQNGMGEQAQTYQCQMGFRLAQVSALAAS